LSKSKFLLDVNVLVALADEDHVHHDSVLKWFRATGKHHWGVCAFTEAGFLRIFTRPRTGGRSTRDATELLTRLIALPGFHYWPISATWSTLAAPFERRVFGHQQITDAYLMGLAVKENSVLVTLDKAMGHLAGTEYRHNLLILE
jgi:toxin-antitoxin system PIN domain toxin